MSQSITLLSPWWLAFRNSADRRSVLRALPFAVIALALWAGIALGLHRLIAFLREVGPLGDIVAFKLMGMAAFGLMGFLALSSLITALSAFYMSRDLPLLMTRPVGEEAIVTAKGIEAGVHATWITLIYMPAVFAAYGAAFGMTWKFALVGTAAFVPFALIMASAGICAAHVITRLFPGGRARDILMALGLVVFLAAYYVMQSSASHDGNAFDNLVGALMRIKTDNPIFPSFWVSETLIPVLRGRRPDPLYPALLVTNAAFMCVFAARLGGWLHARNVQSVNATAPRVLRASSGTPPSRRLAFFWKDAKIFFRDAEQWSQLGVIGSLVMVYFYNFKVIPVGMLAGFTPYAPELLCMGNLLLMGLVLAAVAARFLYVGVSIEGGAFWIVKSAPIGMGRFLVNKYLFGALPLIAVMMALSVMAGTLTKSGAGLTALSAATALMLTLSVSALAVGMGAMYPKFQYESIGAVSMGLGAVAFMVLAFALVSITVTLEAWALIIARSAAMDGAAMTGGQRALVAALGVLAISVNAAAAIVPLVAGKRRLEGDYAE